MVVTSDDRHIDEQKAVGSSFKVRILMLVSLESEPYGVSWLALVARKSEWLSPFLVLTKDNLCTIQKPYLGECEPHLGIGNTLGKYVMQVLRRG